MTQNIEPEPVAHTELPPEVADPTFTLTVNMPNKSGPLTLSAHPGNTIQDLRQMILETPDCQFDTCFNIEFDGVKLDDTIDLGSIEGFTPTSALNMVEAPYTDREVRIHLTRFREVLTNFQSTTPSLGIDVGVSYLSTISGDHTIHGPEKVDESKDKSGNRKPTPKVDGPKPTAFADYSFEETSKDQMSYLIPEPLSSQIDVPLKSLSVSTWNPPPHPRRMVGDLLYLSVQTVENVNLQITCSVTGFYISRSNDKVFDPLPRSNQTLPLPHPPRTPHASKSRIRPQPRHLLPLVRETYPHEADPGRALDAVLVAADAFDLMGTRDWNEDLQSARELPRSTPQERVFRDQLLFRHHTEFVEAAGRVAAAIVSGAVPSINPTDPVASRMYIHGGIFFSHGNDQRESYERFGGAAAAHVAVGKDVDGVGAVSSLDIEGVYTLGTAVVDYKGHRLVAQTIIPGILKKQQQQLEAAAAAEASGEQVGENALVKYGSIDNGKSVESSKTFHELAEKVAKSLHLVEHVVVDGEGKKHELFTSVDTKGISGEDGRRYFLDLSRVTPVDIEFLDQVDKEVEGDDAALPAYPHRLALLRTELVEMYHDTKLRAYIQEQTEKKKKEAEKRKEEGLPEEEEKPLEINFDLRFNPDAFVLVPAADGTGGEDPASETAEGERDVVRQMSKFLSNNVISSTAFELAAHPSTCPLDGQRLTKFLHLRGISMRYLGKLTTLLEKLQVEDRTFFAKELCQEEMTTRAAKSILRDLLRDTPQYLTSNCISHFLNCLFADPSTPVPANAQIRPAHFPAFMVPSEGLAYESLTPALLDAKIREEVRARFRYNNLPKVLVREGRRVVVLRGVCLKVGLQVVARERDWKAFGAFEPADIVNVYPVVKHAEPRTSFGDELQENGLYCLRQGQTPLGIEVLAESSSIYEQVYSPIHPESGRSYRNLAMIRHEGGEMEACKSLQRKAIIVAERTVGFDDPETSQQYMNLGYFECLSGNADAGFRYMRHAVRNLEMLCSNDLHPELASADTQIAMMLSHCKRDMALSTRFHTRAVSTNETIFGKDHEITARSYDHLCQALMMAGDFRGALEAQRVVYRHVKARDGDKETEAVKEAAEALAALTSRAVMDAKRDIESKALKAKAKKNGGLSGAKKAQEEVALDHMKSKMSAQLSGQTAGSMRGNMGHLSVDELMKFIGEGGEGKKKKKGAVA
ncbi:clustered mitochondria-domain-containing protein [Chytridium lagenaria]|nr:clustered mitochondria-domain-containing protein [Chytridium lagenaria]